jgi:hypothetical protein
MVSKSIRMHIYPISRRLVTLQLHLCRHRCARVEIFRAEMLLFRSPQSGNDVIGLFIKNEGQNINHRLKLEKKETDYIYSSFLISLHR